MAEYQLTPYVVTVYPAGDPSSPLKMGRLGSANSTISVVDAIAKTFSVLSEETSPRRRANDSNRQLQVRSVRATEKQVEVACSLGVAGYISRVNLKELGVSAIRRLDDTEWFDLRIVFAASPSARAGILLVESVGNFGMVTHVSELIKRAIRTNVDGVTVAIKPIQDAQAWGETFAGLTTQALEFHTLIQTGDVSDEAAIGGKPLPLSKIIKVSRRGGLGPYSRIVGHSVKQIAEAYGVGSDVDDETWAVATLGSGKRKRKINVQENRVSSISFPIERRASTKPPTSKEFYEVAASVVEDVKASTGLGALVVGAPADAEARNIDTTATGNWTVPDEVAPNTSGGGPTQDAP